MGGLWTSLRDKMKEIRNELSVYRYFEEEEIHSFTILGYEMRCKSVEKEKAYFEQEEENQKSRQHQNNIEYNA